MNFNTCLYLIIETFREWNKDNIPQLSAALSFYAIFSIAPLLVISIAIFSFLIEQNGLEYMLIDHLNQTIGGNAGATISNIMQNIKSPITNFFAFILGVLILIWSAVGLFIELQYCFDVIWKVKSKVHSSWFDVFKNRSYSFIMILGVGFLLLVSMMVSTSLSAVSKYYHYILPHAPMIWMAWDSIISISVITFLFSVLYMILPNAVLQWRDVFFAAFIAALLFSIGKFILSIYLLSSNITTIYGAAASFMILLLWVYYTSQILLWGAEFSKVYAYKFGSHSERSNAVNE